MTVRDFDKLLPFPKEIPALRCLQTCSLNTIISLSSMKGRMAGNQLGGCRYVGQYKDLVAKVVLQLRISII